MTGTAWVLWALCVARPGPSGPAFVDPHHGITWSFADGAEDAQGRFPVVGVRGGQRWDAKVKRDVLVQTTAVQTLHEVQVLGAVSAPLNLWRVESTTSESALALAQRLLQEPGVTDAYPNLWFAHRAAFVPNDPVYVDQWYFQQLNMPAAWDRSLGSADTTVVVVDNGCDAQHPDLVDKLDPGKDVVDNDDDPSPLPSEQGGNHGTACAGLVAASTNNALGMAGACPNCRLRCVRLLSPDGFVPVSSDVAAFTFAEEVGAAVVSNSWGFTTAMPVPTPLAQAINHARMSGRGGLGTLVVFATGNDGRTIGDDELLAVSGVVGVGAITRVGDLASFSNQGPHVDVVAQAGTVTADLSGAAGDDPGDYTSHFGGTSSACPVAAGVAAWLFAAGAEVTADQVEDALLQTALQSPYAQPDSNGHDVQFGYGVVAPLAAWDRLHPPPPDAGAPPGDAGGSGGGGDAPSSAATCSCGAAGRWTAGHAFLWFGLAAGGARRRRRAVNA